MMNKIFGTLIAVCVSLAGFVADPAPAFQAGDDVDVVFEAGADMPVVESGGSRKVTIRALVRPSGRRARNRAPLAVALVLDKSGSMSSDGKMENAKKGALEALRMLGAGDAAAVVVYDNRATVLVRAREVGQGSGEPEFYRAIQRLHPGGSTALYDGVTRGAVELQSFADEGFIPRIVLLSDGIANVGPSSAGDLAALGRSLSRQDITITTIGLGLDYNEDLMTALAAASGGNAYFARHAGMLPEIFARDMEDALEITARKVRVTLRCPEGVRPLRIVGREGKQDGDSLEAFIDNVYGGEKYALFEVELPEKEAGFVLHAADLELEYADAATGTLVRKQASVSVSYTEDPSEAEKSRNGDIVSQAVIARNAEIREEAVRLADEGKAGDAAKLLEQRGKEIQAIAPMAGAAAPKLAREAQSFEGLAESLFFKGAFSTMERKAVINDAYMQKNQQAPVSGDVESEDPESGDVQ